MTQRIFERRIGPGTGAPRRRAVRLAAALCGLAALAACTGNTARDYDPRLSRDHDSAPATSTLGDLFLAEKPDVVVGVNKYIWRAALEVLDFLPLESVDPFSGVIVTGYGTPPGGGRAYKATVLIPDPALDARALKLSLVTRGGGAVSPGTARAVEDAILTRARQLRVADARL